MKSETLIQNDFRLSLEGENINLATDWSTLKKNYMVLQSF